MMARSELQFLVLHFTSFFILSSSLTLPNVASMTKPNCQSRCGDIAIPYPFGIGAGCYLTSATPAEPKYSAFYNNSFEIVCNNSTSPPRPFLNCIGLEVLEISVEGTLRVRSPITFSNCTNKPNNLQAADLGPTPFQYSQMRNRFTSWSCGTTLMTQFLDGSTNTLGGCLSICDYSESSIVTVDNTCGGIYCCQATLPKFLYNFNASFGEVINDRRDECKYAFLVDQQWFTSSNGTNIQDIGDMDFVPVVLEWYLYPYSDIDIYETTQTAFQNSTYKKGDEHFCSDGYQGNPYLLNGCQDINECEDPNKCAFGVCINHPGKFECQFPDPRPFRPVKLVIIVTCSILGLLFLLIGGWWSNKVMKKRKKVRRKQRLFKRNGGLLLQRQLSTGEASVEKIKLFNSKELENATDHFNVNRILGQGGQGTVYKGMLPDGRIVAVKKSMIVDGGDRQVSQFINEIVILSQIVHRNVVKLLRCCLETEVPLLVYEYIANGTLSDYIRHPNEEFPLTWEVRLRVAIEIAGALSYLHSAAAFPIFHRDVKSSNILLDEKYKAKIADFGTSRSVPIDQTHLTTRVQGTFGYLDPQYFQSSQFTDKSDVYSFGVVLVELLTGQKPVSLARSEEDRSLATYFLLSMEKSYLFDILDPRVMKDGGKEEIVAVANLAKRCLNLNGRLRPTMKEVALELEGIQLSIKPSNHTQHNSAEAEYVTNEITQNWDVVSALTGPCTASNTSDTFSSFDVQPLMFLNTK